MIIWKRFFARIGKLIFIVIIFTMAFQWWKPFPDFLTHEGRTVSVPDKSIHFYADVTYQDKDGKRVSKQQIWDHIFSAIAHSEHYLLLDMFLVNDFSGKAASTSTRPLSHELADVLISKKASEPSMPITFITDPINTVYGGATSSEFTAMQRSGIEVIMTDLKPLRDSNLLASGIWRPFFSWFKNSEQGGRLPHPFDVNGPKVTLRSWAALLNFKANHSKLIVYDRPVRADKNGADHKMVTIVTSSNPHDASSAHGNVALEVEDQLWKSAIEGETAVARLGNNSLVQHDAEKVQDETGPIAVTLLHEKGIEDQVVKILKQAKNGDTIDIAMFYIGDRDISSELVDAAARGAKVRMILDPNNDAFGHEKYGIPNRPAAKELKRKSRGDIDIRWCATHGEQCHAKLFMGKVGTSTFLMIGSANFTRRNLDDFNIETSVIATSDDDFSAKKDAQRYFDTLWDNKTVTYTLPYEEYEDTTVWKLSLYHLMEVTGLSSF